MVGLIEIPTTPREQNRGRTRRAPKSRDRWSRPISGHRGTSITRTVSRDPLRYINGANTYQFVGSDPVGMVDATGTSSFGNPLDPFQATGSMYPFLATVKGKWAAFLEKTDESLTLRYQMGDSGTITAEESGYFYGSPSSTTYGYNLIFKGSIHLRTKGGASLTSSLSEDFTGSGSLPATSANLALGQTFGQVAISVGTHQNYGPTGLSGSYYETSSANIDGVPVTTNMSETPHGVSPSLNVGVPLSPNLMLNVGGGYSFSSTGNSYYAGGSLAYTYGNMLLKASCEYNPEHGFIANVGPYLVFGSGKTHIFGGLFLQTGGRPGQGTVDNRPSAGVMAGLQIGF